MFTQSWEFMIAALGPLGPLMVLGVFGAIMILLSLPVVFKKVADPLDRLAGSGQNVRRQNVKETNVRLRYDSGSSTLDRFAPYLEPQDQKEFSATRLKLIQAGYRSRSSVSK